MGAYILDSYMVRGVEKRVLEEIIRGDIMIIHVSQGV